MSHCECGIMGDAVAKKRNIFRKMRTKLPKNEKNVAEKLNFFSRKGIDFVS